MEAIPAIKISEPGGAGFLEEAGNDAPPGLFAQVLARQAVSPGPGLKSNGAKPEGEGFLVPQSAGRNPLPDEGSEGADLRDNLLVEINSALTPLPVIVPPVDSPCFSSGDSKPEQKFFNVPEAGKVFDQAKALGLAARGPSSDAERIFSLPVPPDQLPLKKMPEPGALPLPVNPQGLLAAADKPFLPEVDRERSFPPEATEFPTFGLGEKTPSPEIVSANGGTLIPSPGNGDRDPGGSRETAGKLRWPTDPASTSHPSPSPELSVPVAPNPIRFQAAATLGERGGRSSEGLLQSTGKLLGPGGPAPATTSLRAAGFPESQNPILFTAVVGPPEETVQGRESQGVIPESKPAQSGPADQGGPAAENLLPRADQGSNPMGLEDGKGETGPVFAEGISKAGIERNEKASPRPVSAGLPKAAPPSAKAVLPGEGEREAAAQPQNSGDRLSATDYPWSGGSEALKGGGRSGGGSPNNLLPEFNGAPGPTALYPVEPGAAGGQGAGLPPLAAENNIEGTQARDLFPEPPEEKNPVYKQLSRGLVWSLHRGEDKIQLTLDPPHLGTIFLELHRSRQTVEAQVWTDNPGTKGLLDTQQGQLQKALEQEGFRLNRFEVAVQPDLKSFAEERWAQGRQPAWDSPAGQKKDSAEPAALRAAAEDLIRFNKGNSYIDTWI